MEMTCRLRRWLTARRARRRGAVPAALRPAVEHRLHRGQVRPAVRAAVRFPVLSLLCSWRVLMAVVALAMRAAGRGRCASTRTSRWWRCSCTRCTWAACSSRSTAAWRPARARCWSACSRFSRCSSRGCSCPKRVDARQWAGLLLGTRRRLLRRAAQDRLRRRAPRVSLPSAVALVGISIGTLHQKRQLRAHRPAHRRGRAVHRLRARVRAARAVGSRHAPVQWTPSFLFALGWSVLVLSVGAISVLYWLLRHGAAADVARLFYLVPPVTALQAWLLFGENARRVRAARHGADRGGRLARASGDPGAARAERSPATPAERGPPWGTERGADDPRAGEAVVQELPLRVDERPQEVERDQPGGVRAQAIAGAARRRPARPGRARSTRTGSAAARPAPGPARRRPARGARRHVFMGSVRAARPAPREVRRDDREQEAEERSRDARRSGIASASAPPACPGVISGSARKLATNTTADQQQRLVGTAPKRRARPARGDVAAAGGAFIVESGEPRGRAGR